MTSVRRLAVLATLLAVVATLLVVVTPPPAAEAAAFRPWPALWDVVPATGEVVDAGRVRLAGTATAPSGIASAEVRVDGEVVAHSFAGRSDTAARIQAWHELTPGEHRVSMAYVANDGQRTQRTWRISASEVAAPRWQGEDRYATAVELASTDRARQAAPAAVVARGDDHADALAGVPLAHHLDGPLLLTERSRLTDVTADALRELVQPGGTVHLLGGSSAIDHDVRRAIADLGFRVRRHAGATRYETAAAVATQLPEHTSAVVASGTSFPDALAAAAPAAQHGQPVLLTERDALPPATRDALQGLEHATVVGGTVVVSRAVLEQVDDAVGEVVRVAGEDRHATAVEVLRAHDLDTTRLGLASGVTFPDALVGALDAARLGTGLLLADPRRLPEATRGALRELAPGQLRVYGGAVALDHGVVSEARSAVTDRGPSVTAERPEPHRVIGSLDQLTLEFSSQLDMSRTSISVHFGGRELPVDVATGDFDDTLVLSVGSEATDPPLGQDIPVRVVGVVHDGDGWTHVDRTWTYRKTAMSTGDQGAEVRALQDRLTALGYWLGTPDGTYGSLTVQAVMAFQKYEGLAITGTADDATRQRLAVAGRPVPTDPDGGYDVEIDKRRQLIMFVEDGRMRWTMNTSTGSEVPYDEEGGSGTAITPTGTFTVCHERDYLRESSLGSLWRPKYFQCARGIAVHGATSVPSYPASHGCVRVTYPAMDFVWEQGLMPLGARVWVHGSIPGS